MKPWVNIRQGLYFCHRIVHTGIVHMYDLWSKPARIGYDQWSGHGKPYLFERNLKQIFTEMIKLMIYWWRIVTFHHSNLAELWKTVRDSWVLATDQLTWQINSPWWLSSTISGKNRPWRLSSFHPLWKRFKISSINILLKLYLLF